MATISGGPAGYSRGRKGWWFSLALMVFTAFATVCVVAPTTAQAQTYRFSQVQIEGNRRVDGSTILSYAGIARGETITAGQLNAAYQNIVNSGLFETVTIQPRGATLVITVVEFPTVNVISFEGNRRIKDEDLETVVQSQSRRVYSPSIAESDAANIVAAYEAQGRLAATVTPKIIRRSDNRVDLVFEIVEGGITEIERISFVGNRAFTERRLRRVLQTKQAGLLRRFVSADTFIADRIEFDRQVLADFYMSRGYIDFQVLSVSSEVTRQRDSFLITFNIQEGQQFSIGDVTVFSDLAEIDPDEFLAAVNLRKGRNYSPTKIEATVARLERLATQKGFDFIRVDPRVTRNDRDLSLDIEFAIVRGPRVFVERIDIEGNATTLDRVVRRQFRTVEGDPFNPREILETAERIRALGFFSNAEVTAREGTSPDRVIVDVDVEEQPTGSLSFGATYSVTDNLALTVGFSESNFLGRGQALSFNISTGEDNRRGTFSFTEPAFLGRNVRFRFAVGYVETSSQNSNLYDTIDYTISPSLEFPIGEKTRLAIRYTYEGTDISDYTGTSTILATEASRGSETSSKLGYTVSYDSRRRGLNPDAGILLRLSQDVSGIGGDSRYVESTVLVAAETLAFGDDIMLRAEFEGGMLSSFSGDPTRVTDRYFGNGKIRGFDFNGLGPRDLTSADDEALGGTKYAVARFEAEFPLGLPEEYGIRGGVFADVGSIWGLDYDLAGKVDDGFNLRAVIGFSIFWDTAIGPLRFNFTDAIQKESYDREQSFDLTISTRF